ncbi:hypothetical protein ACFQ9X_02985 [Catenulispora yoronensis]
MAPAKTFAGVRFKYAVHVVLGMCAVTFAVLLVAGRKLDFFYDEWDFVDKAERWRFGDYFVPHQEHWSTVPMVIYRVLLGLNGMHSYLPFIGTLLVLHCANAFLMFLLVRRRGGDALGVAAAGVLLVLGRGSDDFIWAFQIGFSCSVFFGLMALWLLDGGTGPGPGPGPVPVADSEVDADAGVHAGVDADADADVDADADADSDADARIGVGAKAERPSRRALVGGSAALVLSLASSGEGLFFVAAAAALLVVRAPGTGWSPARFRVAGATLVAPILAYAVWYALYGAKHADVAQSPMSLHAVRGLLTFVPVGIGAGVVGMVGLDWHQAWFGFVVFVAMFVYVCRRGRSAALAIAMGVGVVAQFSATGLVRAQFGLHLAGASRYVYIAAVFTLPIVGEALREIAWKPRARAVFAGAVAVSCVCGALVLSSAISQRTRQFERQKAMLQTVWFHRDDPRLDLDAVIDPEDAPTLTVRLYLQTRRELGSPLPEVDARGLGLMDAGAVARAQGNVLRVGR